MNQTLPCIVSDMSDARGVEGDIMCDCYYHKCKHCDTHLPMHLADFLTGQDEIEVVCKDCLEKEFDPQHPFTIFRCKDEDDYVGLMMVIYLTENAKRNADGNHPNEMEFETVRSEGL